MAELPDEETARGQTYPLVVANILAGTLIELSDLIAARVAPGGTLLMSGIWGEEQAQRVQATYEAKGFGPFVVEFAEGGWALLEAPKPGDGAPGNQEEQEARGRSDDPAGGKNGAAAAGDGGRSSVHAQPPAGFEWGGEY